MTNISQKIVDEVVRQAGHPASNNLGPLRFGPGPGPGLFWFGHHVRARRGCVWSLGYNVGMKWKSEAAMQSDFSRWQVSPAGISWIVERSPLRAVAAAFELKHVACSGLHGARVACGPDLCAGRLPIGEHEEMQADALRYASGHGAKRHAKAHKISDMSAGYKPFDCFVLGYGAVARFVMGWTCGCAGSARAYSVPWEVLEQWRASGAASVTEAMAAGVGERLDSFDGGK